jgi:two-component system, chemotaxis family, protein-glutamate methylesterase/glutaminase
VITLFLRSLTQHWSCKLIAVIVSGYDSEGAAALCGIKEVGGITIAQKLDTAGQPDMPESAIQTGCIDFVLSPEDIVLEIVRIAHEDVANGNTGTNNGPCGRPDLVGTSLSIHGSDHFVGGEFVAGRGAHVRDSV